MASFPLFFYFLLCLVSKHSHAQSPESFALKVTKECQGPYFPSVLDHPFLWLQHSKSPFLLPTTLVLDLGGSFLWLQCASRSNIPSSSTLTTPHRSLQCLTTKTHETPQPTSSIFLSTNPEEPCQVFPQNTITGTIAKEGSELVEDYMVLHSVQEFETIIYKLRFLCSPTFLLNGLASVARGMVGLGRSRTSLTSQVFDSFTIHRKLTLCLSSSTGVILFGTMAYDSYSPHLAEILKSLTFTPLVLTNKNKKQGQTSSHEYFINVNSIKINGKRLSLNTSSSLYSQTQLSTIVPYTTMQSSMYATFKEVFLDAAMSMDMVRVASVAPFEACFSSQVMGQNVPIIELVLQSEMVKWSIYGRNSMVHVSNEVMCLGFLDGGINPRNSIVIGGYQLEDVIVQFDLATSMVGFSSSLLLKNNGCSDFNFGSSQKQFE